MLIISFSPNVEEISLDTLIKDKPKVHTTMITPKLTAVMVAMTALVGSGPIAAFAQLDLATGDASNEAVANTGLNSIESVTVGNQEASNTIAVVQSNEATATGGDADADAESEADARSGDVKKSKNGKSSADAASEAIALARGGDATTGDQTNVAVVEDNEQEIEQNQEIESENEIETSDASNDQTAQTGILNIRDVLVELGLGGGIVVPVE